MLSQETTPLPLLQEVSVSRESKQTKGSSAWEASETVEVDGGAAPHLTELQDVLVSNLFRDVLETHVSARLLSQVFAGADAEGRLVAASKGTGPDL